MIVDFLDGGGVVIGAMRANVRFVVDDRGVMMRSVRIVMRRISRRSAASKGDVDAHQRRRVVAVVVVQGGWEWEWEWQVMVATGGSR